MRFAVILLWIIAVLFVGFGVGFVIAPRELAQLLTGGAPATPSAVIDMRAVYGGVALGMGLFFGVCAMRAQWVRPGLIGSLLVVGSIGAGRAVGLIVDGQPDGFMLVFLATEVVSVGLIALALRQMQETG
jgi:hypothetical protein